MTFDQLNHEPIRLMPYQAVWRDRFEKEAAILDQALGSDVRIEHIGSTSVPGMWSKPTIDILAGVPSMKHAEQLHKTVLSLGYDYYGEFETSLPGRKFYIKRGPTGNRAFHLSIVVEPGWMWSRHILFRDYLRQHPSSRERYNALKRELSKKYANDRVAYGDAKSRFIRQYLQSFS